MEEEIFNSLVINAPRQKVNPLALRPIDLLEDPFFEETPEKKKLQLNWLLPTQRSETMDVTTEPIASPTPKPPPNKKNAKEKKSSLASYLSMGIGNAAFMLSGGDIQLRGADSDSFTPFELEKKNKTQAQFYSSDMHYVPLKPIEEDQAQIQFEKMTANLSQPKVYFVPHTSLAEEHKKTYHVFSSDGR